MSVNMEGFLRLSPREKEALQLLIQGMSNKEIAGEMGLSVVTIKQYLQKMMFKTGTRNRTHE